MLKYITLNAPSSINWCEQDYQYTNYIAEFWNSITGIVLCASSLYFAYKNQNLYNDEDIIRRQGTYNDAVVRRQGTYNDAVVRRQGTKSSLFSYIINANNLLFVVGIGTILFHGTLLYIFQLLDEIPMLLIAFEYIKLCEILLFARHKLSNRLKNISIISIIFSYYIYPSLQVFLFMITLVLSIVYIFKMLYQINYKLNLRWFSKKIFTASVIYFKLYCMRTRTIKKLNRSGIIIFLSSLIIWFLDKYFCNYVHHLYLHAVWHILTSIGMFYTNCLIKEIIYCDMQVNLIYKISVDGSHQDNNISID
jgi:dihydroceramidase